MIECECNKDFTLECRIDGTCSCVENHTGVICEDCDHFHYKELNGTCTGINQNEQCNDNVNI